MYIVFPITTTYMTPMTLMYRALTHHWFLEWVVHHLPPPWWGSEGCRSTDCPEYPPWCHCLHTPSAHGQPCPVSERKSTLTHAILYYMYTVHTHIHHMAYTLYIWKAISKLSENHKINVIGPAGLKLWLFKCSIRLGPLHYASVRMRKRGIR